MTQEKAPRPGLSTEVKIVRVIDGDTVEVEITRRFPVRLVHENERGLHFNADEKNTTSGKAAKKFLENLIYDDEPGEFKEIILFIPAGQSINLTDINSFNRLLGEIWVDGEKVTETMIAHGHARLKRGK